MERQLTEGRPFGVLLRYALPVLGGNLFQLFYTLADTVIVGKSLGADALAAVGTNTEIAALVDSLCRSVHRRERPALRPDRTRGNGKNT